MSEYLQRYDKYLASGEPWIEELPSSWETSSLGFECSVKARLGWKGLKAEEYVDEGYIFLATPNIKYQEIDFENVSYITRERYEESPEIMLEVGDVLVTKDGSTTGTTNIVRYLPSPATVNSSLAVLRSYGRLFPDYLFQFFSSHFVQNVVERMRGGMGVPHLFQADLRKFFVLIPPMNEQKQIAAFLDYETAKIDALINKQQQLIALLEEKRQSVINHAVTKGLNPDAPMRDSGVEWIRKLPKHWNSSFLGFECSVKARLGWKGLKASEYVEDGYIFLATPNIKGNQIDFENVNYITEQRYLESPEIMLEIGDVLLTKDGSTTGTTNLVRHLPHEATVNSSIAVVRIVRNLKSEYLYYYFKSAYVQDLINRVRGGMGVPHLFQADLRKFFVPLPPLGEQEKIATYLNERCTKLDVLVEKNKLSLELLQERRNALISAAVMGKIDVRDWKSPSKEEYEIEAV